MNLRRSIPAQREATGWRGALQGGALRMERTVVKAGPLLCVAGSCLAVLHGVLTEERPLATPHAPTRSMVTTLPHS